MNNAEIWKKLQYRDRNLPILIFNPPAELDPLWQIFAGTIHFEITESEYDFILVFGISNSELKTYAKAAEPYLGEDGIFWLCYPKTASKRYRHSDCSRDTLTGLLAEEGYEPVRQISIDENWSSMRFRKTEYIKKMVRTFAVTETGKIKAKKN